MTWTTRPRSKLGPLTTITAGNGPTVLLLHGVGLRAEAWNAQIDALAAAGFSVIAPDMLGHGGSAQASHGATLQDFAAPLAALVDRPVLVVGHSMGAMLALELAATHPDHVKGVVALNAIYQRSPEARAAVQARAAALDGITIPDPTQTLARWFGTASSPEKDACRDWLSNVDPRGYKAAYGVFANSDGPTDATLQGLNCPALYMTGGQEPNSTPDMSHKMADLTPLGRSEIIPDAAHMMPMTHSAKVNAELVEFAKECLT